MLAMIDKEIIKGKIAKMVFEEMFHTGKSAKTIVEEKSLAQITDNSTILKIIDEIIAANPSQTEAYHAGKKK